MPRLSPGWVTRTHARRLSRRCSSTLRRMRIHPQINEQDVTWRSRIDLVSPIGCARLSLHGGSFAVRLSHG